MERTVPFVRELVLRRRDASSIWPTRSAGPRSGAGSGPGCGCTARTQCRPAEVFAVEEQPRLLPAPTARLRPADLRDGEGAPRPSHRGRQGALLGAREPDRRPGRGARRPAAGADLPPGPAGQGPSPPGTRAAVDRPRRPARDKTVYAMRDLDRLRAHGRRATARRSAPTPPRCWTSRCRGPRCARSTPCSAWSRSGAPTRVEAACAERAGRRGGQRRADRPDARTRPPRTPRPTGAAGTGHGHVRSRPGRFARDPDAASPIADAASTPTAVRHDRARADRHPRAQGAAAPGQARPLPRHPPRTARPGPAPAAWATPSSSSSSSPTKSPAARPPPPTCRARAAGLDPT